MRCFVMYKWLSAFALLLVMSSTGLFAANIVVNTTDDIIDSDPGTISLREAIIMANSNPDASTITFGIPGAGPHSLALTTTLPDITSKVTIDASTQIGNDPDGFNIILIADVVMIKIVGLTAGGSIIKGLDFTSIYNVVDYGLMKGLNIENSDNCQIIGTRCKSRYLISGSQGIIISQNTFIKHVGITDPLLITNSSDIQINSNSFLTGTSTTISACSMAVLSNNSLQGSSVDIKGSSETKLIQNIAILYAVASNIKVDETSNLTEISENELDNTSMDIKGNNSLINKNIYTKPAIDNGNISVGGVNNIFKNNKLINIKASFHSNDALIEHNYFEHGNLEVENSTGTKILDNRIKDNIRDFAIEILNSENTLIERDTIYGCSTGIKLRDIFGTSATDDGGILWTTLRGNIIGKDGSDKVPVGNSEDGITMHNVKRILIEKNIISGNKSDGIEIDYGIDIKIINNKIGTNADGSVAIVNGNNGIFLDGHCKLYEEDDITDFTNGIEIKDNLIVGDDELSDIAGNRYVRGENLDQLHDDNNEITNWQSDAIEIAKAKDVLVQGNKLGVQNNNDFVKIGSVVSGIFIEDHFESVTIGGETEASANFIGGSKIGILVKDRNENSLPGQGLKIQKNQIGVNAISNEVGIHILNSGYNLIGNSSRQYSNTIEGGLIGIKIGPDANYNQITKNSITGAGMAIDLIGNEENLLIGNIGKDAPTIINNAVYNQATRKYTLKGTSKVAGDVVEIFSNDGSPQNAIKYVGSATTQSDLTWEAQVSRDGNYDFFVATATDLAKNTSELGNTIHIFPPNSCSECIESFYPDKGQKYVISAWIKQKVSPDGLHDAGIELEFESEFSNTIKPVIPKGMQIEGWRLIEEEVMVPANATAVKIRLKNESGGDAWFDDIRMHPFNASMKSFVYDPRTKKMMAELDERNYATYYEYDNEGQLVRVKKETERGIMTIQESRNNQAKARP